jgi:hypothetical protein
MYGIHKGSGDASCPPVPKASGRTYRILVCIQGWGYFRQLRPAVEILARQGHRLHVVCLKHDRDDFRRGLEELTEIYDNVTFQEGPQRLDGWTELVTFVRTFQCWLQSQDARFGQEFHISDRKRVGYRLPKWVELPLFRYPLSREVLWRLLRRLDAAVPRDPAIDAAFGDFRPDVLVITPLIDRDGGMWDYMYSARALGVPTVFPVHSWDNLSSKARVNAFPDCVLVWNEIQREEAIRFHGIPRHSLVITGAQGFDDWFEMRPSMSRGEFCLALGLDADKPILLYACSAILKRHMRPEIATSKKNELPYFTRWIMALRKASDPRVSQANVIVRPHPKREADWDDIDLSQWGKVAVHPRHGQLPNSRESKKVFFDSLYHSDVVVGINTSAMIEASILGCAVMTILDRDYTAGQEGTQHFQYLLQVGGGLLVTSRSFEEHAEDLARVLDHPTEYGERAQAFGQAFVRPYGLDCPAAPRFAQAVLRTADGGPKVPRRRSIMDRLFARVLSSRWKPEQRTLHAKRDAGTTYGGAPPPQVSAGCPRGGRSRAVRERQYVLVRRSRL